MNEEVKIYDLDPKVEYVKIHGLQRTGTNYLAHLINENLVNTKSLINLGGWKHGHYHAPWFLGREVHIVVINKHPYSWLVSMYKYWTKKRTLRLGMDLQGIPFDTFVRNKAIFELQRDIPYLFRASNPVQHWNNMYFHWMTIRLNRKKLYFAKYEELLANPEAVITDLAAALALTKRQDFVDSDKTFIPTGEQLKPSEEGFTAKDYYQQHEYLRFYTPDLLHFVNEELDLEVLDHYNYYLLSPKEL